jgi:O-antigen/teichoic acid export membrane protein
VLTGGEAPDPTGGASGGARRSLSRSLSAVPTQAATWVNRILGLDFGESTQSVAAVFTRGSIVSVGVNVLGAAISFTVQIVLARALGDHGYGTYSVVLGWMNWAALVTRLQLDGCAARFVSEYSVVGKDALLRGFIARSHALVWLASGVVALFGAAGLVLARARLDPAVFWAGLAACALLPPSAVLQVTRFCLQGLKRMLTAQWGSLVLRPGLLGILTAGTTLLLGAGVGPATAVVFNLLASLAALWVTMRTLRLAVLETAGPGKREYEGSRWRDTAVGFVMVTVAQQLLSPQTDVLIIGALVSAAAAGVYNAASQLAQLITFGVQAISVMGAPMIAELYAERRFHDLQRLTTHFGRLNLSVALPVLVLLSLIGSFSLGLFGEAFRAGQSVLLILSAGQVLQAAVGVQGGYLLTMTGHEREAGRIAMLSAVVNLAAAIILTAKFGLAGTATATVFGGALRSALLLTATRRLLGIRLLPFGGSRPGR